MAEYQGSCYCGNITVTVKTAEPFLEKAPRQSDGDYSTMHGIAWATTPDAVLEIEIQNEAALNLFEQDDDNARFWVCQRCGVVPAVTCDIDGRRKGAVNANSMLDRGRFPPALKVSSKDLSAEQKIERRRENWIGKVVVKDCWDVGL